VTYYASKVLDLPFEPTLGRIEEELKQEGFGILTEIDVKRTLKEKLDVDFKPYRILGACNPTLAYQALGKEDKVGLMLPCNVVVEEVDAGRTEVAVVDPVAAMLPIDNGELLEIAREAGERLKAALSRL
jgi:uncharacterized protein (DUF302 family)